MKTLIRFLYAESIETEKTSLRLAVIKDDISVIGKSAFENVVTVQKIILPESVRCISEKAFKNCKELQEVEFGDVGNWHYIVNEDDDKKQGASKDKSSESLTIQYQAFKDCAKLHTVIFPEYKIIIEKEAFEGCTSLRTVIIPAGAEIADDAFYGLDNIVFVTDSPDVKRFAREHEFHTMQGKVE